MSQADMRDRIGANYGYDEYARQMRGGEAMQQRQPDVIRTTDLQPKMKPSNPKANVGAKKLPLALVPAVCKAYAAIAHFLGWTKYGAFNWRVAGVSVSTYVSALQRHMDRYWEGEWYDSDGTPHLANALACINILIEGHHRKNITDDRPPATNLTPVYDELEQIMEKITEKYGHLHPHHYTQKEDGQAV